VRAPRCDLPQLTPPHRNQPGRFHQRVGTPSLVAYPPTG